MMLEGLLGVHEKGFIHSDLQPGCIVVEMITEILPWDTHDRDDLTDKLLRGESPNIPKDMSKLEKRFLRAHASQRPPTIFTMLSIAKSPVFYYLPEWLFSLKVRPCQRMSGDVAENCIPEGTLCLRGRKSLPQGRVLLPCKRSIEDMFCPFLPR
ncbi:hypothetical protein GOBAR_DD27612 [Gossypium barbadense]|nr:hypothetical protein GOBAR_DD27612 [Gossypium barbadense]